MNKILILFLLQLLTNVIYATPVNSSEAIARNDKLSTLKETGNQTSEQEVGKKIVDPLAKIIMMPVVGQYLQCTPGTACYPNNAYEVSLRPTMPIVFGSIMTINHIVLPYFNAPGTVKTADGIPQLTSATRSNFLAPVQIMSMVTSAEPSSLKFGVGPYIDVPLGSGYEGARQYLGVGVAGIMRYSEGGFTVAGLFQDAWNIGNNGQPMLFNPNVAYNFPNGWYVLSSPIMQDNLADNFRNSFVVPIGGGVGKVLYFGALPVAIALSFYDNIIAPPTSPGWETKLGLTFVLPQ